MPTCKVPHIPSSEITPKSIYIKRRQFMVGAVAAGVAGLGGGRAFAALDAKKSAYVVDDKITPKEDATTYNNYYEFGVNKGDPAEYSGDFKPMPVDAKAYGSLNPEATELLAEVGYE